MSSTAIFLRALILLQLINYLKCSIMSIGYGLTAAPTWWNPYNNTLITTEIRRNPAVTPPPKGLENSIAVTFVNGIYHSFEECQNLSTILENFFGVKVYLFYNPSTGSWVKDFSRASFDLVSRSNDIILAKNLTDHFRKVFATLEPKGRILHLAHSGGAILTYLAAKHHLTIAEASRIDVITFGGGKSITRKYFSGGRVCNYYAKNDPLTFIDRRTNKLLKRYESRYREEDPEESPTNSYGVIRDLKHNTTFVFLPGKANNAITDHSMFGPTYLSAVELEAEHLKERLQHLLLQTVKERSFIRKIRKLAANVTGYHHFWEWRIVEKYYYNSTYDELYPSWRSRLRSLRKNAAKLTNIHGLFSGKYRKMSEMEGEVVDLQTEEIIIKEAEINDETAQIKEAPFDSIVIEELPSSLSSANATEENKGVERDESEVVQAESKISIGDKYENVTIDFLDLLNSNEFIITNTKGLLAHHNPQAKDFSSNDDNLSFLTFSE